MRLPRRQPREAMGRPVSHPDPETFAGQAEAAIRVWADVRNTWWSQRADLELTAEIVFLLQCERPCPAHHETVQVTYRHPDPEVLHRAVGIACLLTTTPKDPTT